jgi:hypothetical protein
MRPCCQMDVAHSGIGDFYGHGLQIVALNFNHQTRRAQRVCPYFPFFFVSFVSLRLKKLPEKMNFLAASHGVSINEPLNPSAVPLN